MRALTVLAFALLAVHPNVASAVDCGKAKTRPEKLVCASDEASSLDRELAATYRDALESQHGRARERLEMFQDRWGDAVLKGSGAGANSMQEDELASYYRLRIDLLRVVAGRTALSEVPGPEQFGDDTLGWRWVDVRLGDREVLRYPQLTRSRSAHLETVNTRIREDAQELVDSYVECSTGSGFGTFTYSVKKAKQGFFEVELADSSWGCFCGCAHPSTSETVTTLFDLETGNDAVPVLRRLVVQKEGAREALLELAYAHEPANPFGFRANPADGSETGGGELGWLSFDPATGAVLIGVMHCYAMRAFDFVAAVRPEQVVTLVELDSHALSEVPRFRRAGYLSDADVVAVSDLARRLGHRAR
ncbi:MAG: hypothetical protein QM765_46900 [Myxococcales bacterium]